MYPDQQKLDRTVWSAFNALREEPGDTVSAFDVAEATGLHPREVTRSLHRIDRMRQRYPEYPEATTA